MSHATYKVAVLGGGPGGYVAAIRASQLGASVVLVEERELGGTCLNRGCIPAKAVLDSAHALLIARKAAEFGVLAGDVSADLAKINERRDKICDTQRKGIASLLKKNKVDVIEGRGVLLDKNRIAVAKGERTVTAEKIIVATGSEPLHPPMFAFDGNRIIDSDDLLKLNNVPSSMLIVGGGFIGCEWATAFQAFGSKVTIVEMMEQLLPTTDSDVARELLRALKKAGMTLHLKTRVETVSLTKGGVSATLSDGTRLEAEKMLVCVGRKLNSDGIGIESVGVATDRGAIVIDEHCRTNQPNIYAIGDVTGRMLLAHVASRQGIVAAESAIGGSDAHSRMDYDAIPFTVFTEPEIGCVGMTVEQAEGRGMKVKTAQYPYRPLGRARTLGALEGMFKIVADAVTGELLGVHIIGARASDIIAEAALAIRLQATVEEVAQTVHAHPTLAEGMMEASKVWLGRPIHS